MFNFYFRNKFLKNEKSKQKKKKKRKKQNG